MTTTPSPQPAISSVDDYIASFPERAQKVLQAVRTSIHAGMPDAEEAISYKIAAFKVDGHYLIYMGGWKQHVGLYPVPVFESPLEDELKPYRSTKDTLKFLYAKPVPYDLIERLVGALVDSRRGS